MGIMALVLGLTGFGCLGIHRFLMGNKNSGLISLLASLLTCGAAGVIFTVISIAEGIIYLTMTDEKFYQTYTVDRKQWF